MNFAKRTDLGKTLQLHNEEIVELSKQKWADLQIVDSVGAQPCRAAAIEEGSVFLTLVRPYALFEKNSL